MKLIQIALDDSLHRDLKLAAFKNGTTMKEHIVGLLRDPLPVNMPPTAKMTKDGLKPIGKRTTSLDMDEIITKAPKTKQEIEKVIPQPETGICKNGHPLVRGDRCMGKGCKYSVYG